MNKIYMASKARWRPSWRRYRDAVGLQYNIISRWIDVDDKFIGNETPEDLDYQRLWIECSEDVIRCDVLILYAEEGEVLKGALVEVGIALAMNKMIYLAGNVEAIKANGTWYNHPLMIDMTGKPIGEVIHRAAFYGQEG